MSRRGVGPAWLAVAALALAPAAAHAARGQSLHVDAGLRSRYDDNILEYSDNQLRDFESGLHPLRFSLESTDDVVLEPSLALIWQLDQGRGRRHALRLRWEGDFHAKNGTADFRPVSARWTESFRHDRRFSLGYFRVDHFYLRQLRDEDLPLALGDLRYRRAGFDLQIASASWRQRVGRRAHVGFEYQYEDRKYVPEFRERSSGTHQGELRADWDRLPHRGDVELHLGYRHSGADGTDGDEVGGVRDDDDVSYHGIESGITGRMEFSRRGAWRFGGDLGYEFETRRYDSDLPADRFHFGRDDALSAIELGLRLGYRPHWSLRGYYRLEDNVAHLGTSAPPTSDSGSYRVNQVGIEIGWSGDAWHQAPPEPDAEGTD